MNNLDKQYQALLQDILDNGVEKKDRTGTGTLSVFGRQIRHKMSEGFPLLTTKKMAWKSMVTELLWFLRGDTNIKYLVDNGCNIWNGDAYQSYCKRYWGLDERGKIEYGSSYYNHETNEYEFETYSQEEFINRIKTDDEFAKKWGELGPIYGKQWRSWENIGIDIQNMSEDRKSWSGECWNEEPIDQIANLINDLKTNPDSRRLMVNAWNVGEIDQMVLPPCHYGFQVYTRELSREEQYKDYPELLKVHEDKSAAIMEQNYAIAAKCREIERDMLSKLPELPKRAISLMWNQRSVDTFLGLPFNIASYGLLLEIIAKEVNMAPDELIGNLGDVHLYSNHIEQAKEQIGRELGLEERWKIYYKKDLDINRKHGEWNSFEQSAQKNLDKLNVPTRTREPYPLPKLWINNLRSDSNSIINDVIKWSVEDFKIENYQSHPAIKAPLSN